MCYGENQAAHTVTYLNSQLCALWEISSECLHRHGTNLKPEVNYRYSFALAEYYFGKHRPAAQANVTDMWFHATFMAPSLQFLCDHEALVTLNIAEGHFNVDHVHASDFTAADPGRNKPIKDLTVTLRVPFKRAGIKGRDTTIGTAENAINMFVFDFINATLTDISDPKLEKQCLETYLKHYLRFLKLAGHHVLFSLPEFNAESPGVLIDFSLAAQTLHNLSEIQGVAIEHINRFLSTSWLKAAMLASAQNGETHDRPAIALAEYRSTWITHDEDVHFHLTFGAPQVAALCNDEVLLYFHVDEALFYDGEDFSKAPMEQFHDWKVAVLFDIIRETEDEGKVIRLKIDTQRHRFMHQFSTFKGRDESSEDHGHCVDYVIEFITGEYLSILENAGSHVIYHHDIRWPKLAVGFEENQVEETELIDAEWTRNEVTEDGRSMSKVALWRELTQNSDMCGFDVVTALSQTAINAQYRSHWTQASAETGDSVFKTLLAHWKLDQSFSAEFKPLTVRLRSDGKAVISLNIQKGSLKPLRAPTNATDSDLANFEDWRVAFEVELKLCAHSDLLAADAQWPVGPEWQAAFKASRVYKAFATEAASGAVGFKHIYLDFKNVTFLDEFSRFNGLFTSQSRRSIDKVQAAVVYLRDHYLKQLVSAGHHILYTVPILNVRPEQFDLRLYHCLSSVVFHVYSKKASSERSWNDHRANEPTVIILGMCGGRAMPASILQYSTDWVARAGKFSSYGTAAVSADLFLRERLLPILSKVNAKTTIIPRFSGIERGTWKLALGCWSDHPERKNEYCAFDLDHSGSQDGALKFQWQHQDIYHYEHRGGRYVQNGRYSVSCITNNYLEIPTTFKHGTMEIKAGGRVTLQLSVETSTVWRSRSAAEWQASIAVHSEANGLKIVPVRQPPQFMRPISEGDTDASLTLNPEDLLKQVILATSVDLSEAANEFKIFEQAWQSCWPGMSAYNLVQPVFNSRGDLLFEIQSRAAAAPTGPVSSSPTSKFKPKNGNRRRAQQGLQPYPTAGGPYSLSRQPSFEHLHVDTGSMRMQQSFSRNNSANEGLSAEPGSFSSTASPYPNMYGDGSPMGQNSKFSQSQSPADFGVPHINDPRPQPMPMPNVMRSQPTVGSRPASSMSNHQRTAYFQNGSSTFVDSSYSSPQQQPELAFEGVRVRAMGSSSGQGDFDSDGIHVHAMGERTNAFARNAIPGIQVTEMHESREEHFTSSSPPISEAPFRMRSPPLAAPRPSSAASTRFHISGTTSGRATPSTMQYQTTSTVFDVGSFEGRQMMREGLKHNGRAGLATSTAVFEGSTIGHGLTGEYRSSSRASSRSGVMSGSTMSMSSGTVHSSTVEHGRLSHGSFPASGGFTHVTTYE